MRLRDGGCALTGVKVCVYGMEGVSYRMEGEGVCVYRVLKNKVFGKGVRLQDEGVRLQGIEK